MYPKLCHICSNAVGSDIALRPHKCMNNWIEASKAIECDGIVHLCCIVPKRNSSISRLISDGDTICAQFKHKEEGTKVALNFLI